MEHVEVSFTTNVREQRDIEEGSVAVDDNEITDVADTVEINLDGELETAFPWNDYLANKTSAEYLEKKNSLESDLKTILEADDDIKQIEMTDCNFTEVGSARRRRSTDSKKAKANYNLRVLGTSLNATKTAAKKTITSANHTEFPSLSANSATSYTQTASLSETNNTVPNVTEPTTEAGEETTKATTKATISAETTETTTLLWDPTVSKSAVDNGSPAITGAILLLGAVFCF